MWLTHELVWLWFDSLAIVNNIYLGYFVVIVSLLRNTAVRFICFKNQIKDQGDETDGFGEDFPEDLGNFSQGFLYISLISPEESAKLRWVRRGGGDAHARTKPTCC